MFLRNFSIEELVGYVFELQTTAEKYFELDRVREYLTIVHRNQGGDIALGVMAYIVIVLGKYTQMMAAYNIQRQNTDAVVELYEWFNSRFQQFTTLFRSDMQAAMFTICFQRRGSRCLWTLASFSFKL